MRNRFQQIDFKNVDEFLEYLPEHELKLVILLRSIIFQCIPDCKEKLSYNVPFYGRHKNICFIWPSSVPWGKINRTGVRLGFTNGYLLHDEINYLDKGDRKQVYMIDFFNTTDVDVDLLKSFLYEAVTIDEEMKNNKKKK